MQAVIFLKPKFWTFGQTCILPISDLKIDSNGSELSNFQYRLIWISDILNRLTKKKDTRVVKETSKSIKRLDFTSESTYSLSFILPHTKLFCHYSIRTLEKDGTSWRD